MNLLVEVREKNKLIFTGVFAEFPVLFGRAEHCHISLPSVAYLSAVHGTIVFEGDQFYIVDLESKFGLQAPSGEKFLKARFKKSSKFLIRNLEFSVKVQQDSESVKGDKTLLVPDPVEEIALANQPYVPSIPSAPKMPSPEVFFHDPKATPEDRLVALTEFLRLEVRPNFRSLAAKDVTLQGVLVWGGEILDVRQFRAGDVIWVGGDVDSPVYLPGTKAPIILGKTGEKKGQLQLATKIDWRLHRQGMDFDPTTAQARNHAKDQGAKKIVDVEPGDLFTCDLGNQVSLHLRYVEKSRFFIPRTWIENREEFVKALRTSAVLHVVAAIALVLITPKEAPPSIENVPRRFARLLVEPPKSVVPPATPTPAPTPAPEPPKPTPAPEPEPVPVKKQQPKPKPKNIPKVVPKAKPQPVAPVQTHPVEKAPPSPPKPSAETQAANELASALSSLPAPPSAGANKAIKIENTSAMTAAGHGAPTAGVSGALKSKGGKLTAGAGMAGGLDSTKVGQFGYASSGGSKNGKRGVVGGIVGTPRLDDFSATSNGLTEKEIMATVNKYLSQVHRCYERALLSDEKMAGRIQYEWDITPAGQVGSVRVKRSEIANSDALNDCVIALFKTMKFPAAKNKQPTTANIGFPFGKEN